VKLKVLGDIADVRQAEWDALFDPSLSPFTRHTWLEALEHSGCVGGDSDWEPHHLTLWDSGRLVAAAPAYLKHGSDGDFSRDWGWAEAAERAGIGYYPKLVIAIPFTPVTGRRVLTASGVARPPLVQALMAGARETARSLGATSVHVLFPTAEEAQELEAAGLSRRIAFQYHWRNEAYADPDAFLARLDAKRRHQARRERAAPAQQGIEIRTIRGEELARARQVWGESAFELHRSTVDKLMWGRRWLNQAFYARVFHRMPEALEVVAAHRGERLIAGAFNVATPTHLYGRYWGCFEEHRFLHFNVCLYHSIDECIRSGLKVFEGGAGGEHKIARGFMPAETYSNHLFFDPRLAVPLSGYIAKEAEERAAALERFHATSPVFRKRGA
jgi:predicted N-acyltransferase